LAVAFGDAPARRAPGQTSSSSSSAWHYEPTTSLSPSSSTTTAAPTASSTDTHLSSSSGGISLNGVSVPSFDSSRPFAVAYSPYTSSGGCKDVSAIESDLQAISASGFQCIRLYGTDCNQVSNVLSALESTGSDLKLFLGVFDLGSASSQASTLISALGGDWSKVVTVSVGNEPVNQGLASAATVVSTTSAVRSQLRA
jgi:exo-beta-1,3-glucanase (GH17 family)